MLRGLRKRIDVTVDRSAVARFWNRVERGDGCWRWTGSDRGNGYGCLKVNGQVVSAHVVSWLMHYHEIPDGCVIAHKCDNRNCVNPDHLEAISASQNNRDANERLGRKYAKGAEVHSAVLSDEIIREIRSLMSEGLGYVRIARRLGLSKWTVKKVTAGKTWRHVV